MNGGLWWSGALALPCAERTGAPGPALTHCAHRRTYIPSRWEPSGSPGSCSQSRAARRTNFLTVALATVSPLRAEVVAREVEAFRPTDERLVRVRLEPRRRARG